MSSFRPVAGAFGCRLLARYAAWIHATAPKSVAVDLPGRRGQVAEEVSLQDGADTRIDLGLE